MLTKSQAQVEAGALLEQGKAERIARLESQAERIPFYYRNSFLSSLPGWRQAQLVRDARLSGHSTWLDIAAVGSMVMLGLAVWLSFEHAHPFERLGPFEFAMGGLGALLRIMLVKLRLQELLIEELSPRPSDGI
jgi:hypothetical protein